MHHCPARKGGRVAGVDQRTRLLQHQHQALHPGGIEYREKAMYPVDLHAHRRASTHAYIHIEAITLPVRQTKGLSLRTHVRRIHALHTCGLGREWLMGPGSFLRAARSYDTICDRRRQNVDPLIPIIAGFTVAPAPHDCRQYASDDRHPSPAANAHYIISHPETEKRNR